MNVTTAFWIIASGSGTALGGLGILLVGRPSDRLLDVLLGFTAATPAAMGFVKGSPVMLMALAGGIAIFFLEIFVAFLQAFIFALLASVFIGQIRTAHH